MRDPRSGQTGKTITFAGDIAAGTGAGTTVDVASGHWCVDPLAQIPSGLGRAQASPAIFFLFLPFGLTTCHSRTQPITRFRIYHMTVDDAVIVTGNDSGAVAVAVCCCRLPIATGRRKKGRLRCGGSGRPRSFARCLLTAMWRANGVTIHHLLCITVGTIITLTWGPPRCFTQGPGGRGGGPTGIRRPWPEVCVMIFISVLMTGGRTPPLTAAR